MVKYVISLSSYLWNANHKSIEEILYTNKYNKNASKITAYIIYCLPCNYVYHNRYRLKPNTFLLDCESVESVRKFSILIPLTTKIHAKIYKNSLIRILPKYR